MNSNHYKQFAGLTSVCLLILLTACTLSSYNTHPEYHARIRAFKNPVLLMSDVGLYQMTSDGMATLRDDWSVVGRRNLQEAIFQCFNSPKGNLKPLAANEQSSQEIEEVRALYKLVHKTMDQQTFGSSRTNSKNRGFRYSLGSLEPILHRLDADAAIFVTGYDKISSGGRKSMIDLAIADSSGTILYYSVKGTIKGRDLRDPESARSMVQDLLAGFSKAEEG
jgi:hypothetical protein